jgi:hypothetical protein
MEIVGTGASGGPQLVEQRNESLDERDHGGALTVVGYDITIRLSCARAPSRADGSNLLADEREAVNDRTALGPRNRVKLNYMDRVTDARRSSP